MIKHHAEKYLITVVIKKLELEKKVQQSSVARVCEVIAETCFMAIA